LNNNGIVHHPITPEEEENMVPRMGILLNGRTSIDPPPLQLPPLYLQSDEELDRIVNDHHESIENSFRDTFSISTQNQTNGNNGNNINNNNGFQGSYHNYTLLSNESDSEDENQSRRTLFRNYHQINQEDEIDSEEEEIRQGGRRTLLFNYDSDNIINNNNENENDSIDQNNGNNTINDNNININNDNSINEASSSLDQASRRSNIVFVEVEDNNEEDHLRRRNNRDGNNNNGDHEGNDRNDENDLIDEIDIAQEVENHHAQQEARNEAIQNENFGIHCKYQSEKLMNKSISWTLNLCLIGMQSRFSFEYDEFLSLLYKYEQIRNENIFDTNLFLLKMNIEYYQKRFQSYKRQLIYIMSACRNLLIMSDDPYYDNFTNISDENRHARNHLDEIDDHNMSDSILNPESVASIRSLLEVLSHSFLKIEKYNKDLFEKDNLYISTKILKHVKNDEENKPPLPQNITVYSVPETTIINTMVNSMKEDKTIKLIKNEKLLSKKEKGKVEISINNEGYDEIHPQQENKNLKDEKLNPIPIHKIPSTFSSTSIDSIDKIDNNSSGTANNSFVNLDINKIQSNFSSYDSFHSFFNINSSFSEHDSFIDNNKLYSNAYSNSNSDIKMNMNSEESTTKISNDFNEKSHSKIQNFPPEILTKIFNYVRIIPKDKNLKKQKHQNKCSKGKQSDEASSSLVTQASSSSSSFSKQTDYQEQNIYSNNGNSTTNNYEDYSYDNIEIESNHEEESKSSNLSNSNAYNDVYSCIRVCRHWCHIAQKELYHTLSFNYTNIINSYLLLKIAASLEVLCKSEKISPTRSIVLRVSHDGKVPDSKEWYDRKGELAFIMILRNCPNLKYIALFGVNFSNLTAEVISSVCTNVHQLLLIPFSTSNINERGLLRITEHCHKICSLILSFFKFTSKANIRKIFKNLEPSLKNLDLIQAECEENDFDYIIPYLKNIEELGLMLTTSFSDSSLTLVNRHCSKLEYLNFTGLLNISDQGLENLFRMEKDSSFMNENLSSKISDELLFHNNNNNNNNNNNQSHSHSRDIIYSHSHSHYPKNKRIKRINLSDCMDITDEGLRIISNHCEALEAISIDDCPRITDEGFEAFIKHQSQMKYLSIANSETLTNKSIECLNKYCPYIEKLNIKGCLKIREKTVKNFISLHPNLNTLCFHQEKNTFSRGFINYLNKNYSTEDFDDMFLKWNQ